MNYIIVASRHARALFYIVLTCSLTALLSSQADAAVKGPCYICHTMHNSQNGDSKHMPDTPGSSVGWDSSNELAGGSASSTPADNLLVTNCVGCHSSSTGNTTVTIGTETIIPIVNNTTPPTQNILAGGNFYWVGAGGDDTKGHNVYGISGDDDNHIDNLKGAPGNKNCSSGSCHFTLSASGNEYNRPGCQGCHLRTAHHDDSKPYYRFLAGHEGSSDLKDPTEYYVEGEEHANWEKDATSSDHNFYKGYDGPISGSATLENTHSISTFCSGCHYYFHRKSDEFITGIGDYGAWVRHPTDIDLPTTGDFSGYDPENAYNLDAPVAWTDPTNSANRGTPIVMCLSCHRPHGSANADMLRWSYSSGDCLAGSGASDCGCFICHTGKDGVE